MARMLQHVDFRTWIRPACLLAGLSLAGSSQALEISPPRLNSGLGQALQVQIDLRLAAGDKISKTLSDPCFKVDLSIGDRQLKPAEFMRTIDWQAVEGRIVMRLQTQAPVTEPVVFLSLGCPRQQFSLMLDPSLPAPAAGPALVPSLAAAAASAPAKVAASAKPVVGKANQVRAEAAAKPPSASRTQGLALRLDPGLALPAPASSKASAPGGDWYAPLPGIRLLLALDVGAAFGAMTAGTPGVEGPRPDRLKQAESQFVALQAEHQALQTEIDQLSAELLAREQRRAASSQQSWVWAVGLLLGLLGVGGTGWWWQRRRAPRPAAS